MSLGSKLGTKKGPLLFKRPAFNPEAWTTMGDSASYEFSITDPLKMMDLSEEILNQERARRKAKRATEKHFDEKLKPNAGLIDWLLHKRSQRNKSCVIEEEKSLRTKAERGEDLLYIAVLWLVTLIIITCFAGAIVKVLSGQINHYQTVDVMAELTYYEPWDERFDYDMSYTSRLINTYEALGMASIGSVESLHSVEVIALRPVEPSNDEFEGTIVTYKISLTDRNDIRKVKNALVQEIQGGFLNASDSVVFTGTYFECRPGQYVIVSSQECAFCNWNFYNNDHRATRCKPCPNGTVTSGQGALRKSDCRRIPCLPPRMDHAAPEHSDSVAVGDTIRYVCDDGYKVGDEDSFDAFCKGRDTMIGLQECSPVACPLPELVNAIYSTQGAFPGGNITFPQEVKITCIIDKEFSPRVFEKTAHCQSNGTMTEIPPCLTKQCILHTPPYNNIYLYSSVGDTVFVGEEVLVYCSDGYEHENAPPCSTNNCIGDSPTFAAIQCQPNQIMSNPPHCNRKPCTLPILDDSIYYNAASGQQVFYQDEVSVLCPFGKAHRPGCPVQTLTCQANGNITLPDICYYVNCTAGPLTGNNLYVSITEGTVLSFGDVVSVHCPDDQAYSIGFTTTVITCQSNGYLSIPPDCHPKKCDLPNFVDHAYIGAVPGNFIYLNKTISVFCKNPLKTMAGSPTSEIRCSTNMTVTEPISCTL